MEGRGERRCEGEAERARPLPGQARRGRLPGRRGPQDAGRCVMTPAEIRAVFARRLGRERERQGWSVREMASKGEGVLASTISRAENGHEIWLSAALAMADVLGLTLAEMFGEPDCANCDGKPPARFSCPECGRTGVS